MNNEIHIHRIRLGEIQCRYNKLTCSHSVRSHGPVNQCLVTPSTPITDSSWNVVTDFMPSDRQLTEVIESTNQQ